ncbi:RloB family protein [Dyadobacter sp.]|uniref:RloB family protein n=1 Tax=Dyadobacter sp. TaxID=1914288 RepID=UPI003F6F7DAA
MNPWELKPNDARTEDGLILYLIFCEDSVSEVQYFKSFKETDRLKINAVGNYKSKYKHVLKVIAHCRAENLMMDRDGVLYLDQDLVRVWCVFDNDLFNEKKPDQEVLDFRLSVEMAINYGLNVAWSNDAFELWILLHFVDYERDPENNSRKRYYEELTTIFESRARESPLLGEHLKKYNFSYKENMKSLRAFTSIVLPELEGREQDAINRAKALNQFHLSEGRLSCDLHLPGTTVYKLVEELRALAN